MAEKDCALGKENKARLDNLYSLVNEHKTDLQNSIIEIKDTVKDMGKMVMKISLSVFISVLAILVNIIMTLWATR